MSFLNAIENLQNCKWYSTSHLLPNCHVGNWILITLTKILKFWAQTKCMNSLPSCHVLSITLTKILNFRAEAKCGDSLPQLINVTIIATDNFYLSQLMTYSTNQSSIDNFYNQPTFYLPQKRGVIDQPFLLRISL